MIKKTILLFSSFLSAMVYAVGPQGNPQIYLLLSRNKGQVVMLSNWHEGKKFAAYEDGSKATERFFQQGQKVWVCCGGRNTENEIADISRSPAGSAATAMILANDPACQGGPLLLSNHPFPKQEWISTRPAQEELNAIRAKLAQAANLQVTKIVTEKKGVFFLVLDPSIPAIYDVGGHRLLDGELNQLSVVDQAPLMPLIDLDGDTVPEFFIPSADGLDAWLVRLYPQVDRDMYLH